MRSGHVPPNSGIGIGASVVVLTGVVWLVFGPGSAERTVPFAVVDRVDSAADGSTVHFLAPRCPNECTDAESNGLGLVVRSAVDPSATCRPKAMGNLVLRVGRTRCELVSFTPRDYGDRAR